ncbi:hypothetical protein Poli38472_003077 [Pythium oligandrum]|uniref:Uncharacterized protein n=1 Tax=Pythium oligandrum TaxID=41045 RepID=A0A8K1FEZ7_PYTOL|nr:hypothetical protein Poli38472_003077 [Pythium oligandrum]|eukprot:TMW57152.1 hypothetical protein Poli38472_003077 [Pythium oligandrum]
METWSAIRRLLFPSLASFVQTASQVSGTSNEKVLASVLSTVLDKIKTGMVSNEHTRALLRLIQEWDEYCERTNEFPESSGSKMGLQVMSQLPVVPSIVRCYNSRDVLISESPDMLQFVEELLRAASDSPPTPEGRVFELVSWIREIPSRSADIQSNKTLISHSDEAIRRVLSVFHDHIDGHCRWVLEELVTQQRIDDFARCLREWLARLNGFASDHKETRQELIRLGNRFVYWAPSRSQSLRAVFRPVDVNLLTALRGVTDGQQVSIVRLNLLMRSYLSGSNVPNLLALTGALVDTALLAPSSESLHGLFKLIQLFSGWIVVEVVVDKVQAGMMLDRSVVQSARNTEQEALLRLQNALTFTAESSRFLQPWRLRFTSHLFSLQVAEQWLVQFIRPSTSYQVDFVDSVLGFITGHEGDALREAFTLAALFSTILISVCSEAPEWVERVSDLTVRLTTQLAEPEQQSDTPVKSTDTTLLYLKAVANDVECSRVCVPRYGERPVVVDSWRVSASSARRLLNCEFISEAPQFFFPFDSWLRATLAVSATPWTGDSHDRWDDAWIEMVVAFYLPLQFKDNVRALLFAWLQTWLGMQTEGVNSSDFVRLDASQRSLFWQLCSRVSDQSAWTYLVECVRITLADCQGSIHLLEMAVASLDLVQRSILVLNHQQERNSIVDELTDAIVSLSKTKPHDGSDLSAAVYVQLLSPVLEVFVYAAAIQSSDKVTSERVRLNTKAVAEAITRYAFGVRGDSQESSPAKTVLTRLLERWRGLYGHLNRQRVGDVMQMLLAEVVHQE